MTGLRGSSGWWPEVAALRRVLGRPVYALSFPVLGLAVGVLYALLLPALVIGSLRWEWLRFVTPAQWVLVAGMSVLLPATVLVNVFLWRNPSCARPVKGAHKGLAGVVIALLPNALCCGPAVPLLLSVFVTGTTLSTLSPTLQYYVGTYEPVLYAAALLVLWVSLRVASRRVLAPGTPFPQDGSECGCTETDENPSDPAWDHPRA